MNWFCKKSPTPVINVFTPWLHNEGQNETVAIGLDKNNNKLWFCTVKNPDIRKSPLKEENLQRILNTIPIHSIEKKANGGLIICWETGRFTELEPLESGKVFARAIDCWWMYTPEAKPFEYTGNAEFNLLKCLFTNLKSPSNTV